MFRQGSLPLDPDYVTQAGCRTLLSKCPKIASILHQAVQNQDSELVASSHLLSFYNPESPKPHIAADIAFAAEIGEFLHKRELDVAEFAQTNVSLPYWPGPPVDDDQEA
ncbi:hypothetical protein HDZ31DRAFT_70532, partial [Schizophyllum fasciatum]